jgi:hypothetical protein
VSDFTVSFDEPQPDPAWDAIVRRMEANARPKCEYCGAFISRERAAKCRYWTDYGWEYSPECEPGKGCNRPWAGES